jgi:HrpA-like RNA helicase
VLPLHSAVLPPGVRKVVLATNIAVTTITVGGVGFVVDTGRMKENRYDPARRLSGLENCLVSRANARQQCRRAGRVQPGPALLLYNPSRSSRHYPPAYLSAIAHPIKQGLIKI